MPQAPVAHSQIAPAAAAVAGCRILVAPSTQTPWGRLDCLPCCLYNPRHCSGRAPLTEFRPQSVVDLLRRGVVQAAGAGGVQAPAAQRPAEGQQRAGRSGQHAHGGKREPGEGGRGQEGRWVLHNRLWHQPLSCTAQYHSHLHSACCLQPPTWSLSSRVTAHVTAGIAPVYVPSFNPSGTSVAHARLPRMPTAARVARHGLPGTRATRARRCRHPPAVGAALPPRLPPGPPWPLP